jgi:hypothetical protein
MKRLILLASLAAFCLPAIGEIYRCQDAAGNVTFSNVTPHRKDCKRMHLEPGNSMPPPRESRGRASPAPSASPEGFPRVDPETQKNRDNGRRQILMQELQSEQTQLDSAKKALADQENIRNGNERNYQRVLDRLQPFKDEVSRHQRNIDAINKELSNLR